MEVVELLLLEQQLFSGQLVAPTPLHVVQSMDIVEQG